MNQLSFGKGYDASKKPEGFETGTINSWKGRRLIVVKDHGENASGRRVVECIWVGEPIEASQAPTGARCFPFGDELGGWIPK